MHLRNSSVQTHRWKIEVGMQSSSKMMPDVFFIFNAFIINYLANSGREDVGQFAMLPCFASGSLYMLYVSLFLYETERSFATTFATT